MRPALHSHLSAEDVSVYNSLPHQLTSSAPTYPAFPTSLHHVDSNHHDISSYEGNHIEHGGLHLDPNVSPDVTPLNRHFSANSSPYIQRDVLRDSAPTSVNASADANNAPKAHPPPPPPVIPSSLPLGHYDMAPPPHSTHPSWQSLHDYAQTHASAHGYALSINTTAKNRSRIKLACVCYGQPKNTHKLTPETRVRKNRVSYKTGCMMWIEAKKHDDGLWVLTVGQGVHNHLGRAPEGWAMQRKRTWGVQSGRVGVGGVTAKEERAREKDDNVENEQPIRQSEGLEIEDAEGIDSPRKASHSLESGSLVWKIIEQEMLRKNGPRLGRDRGVGRTVKILEERLPGIHIFKRDVYNIRAQIKRARKAAGQQLGEGLDDSDNEDDAEGDDQHEGNAHLQARNDNAGNTNHGRSFSQIDPTLIEQCNSALQNIPNNRQEESEVERLRREVVELKQALSQRTKELNDKNSENEGLRVQMELATMALYNERGPTQ
ncbi:hypothetical protein P280DRAFT_466087 [Massarina eburnea CBS 473.64]|uniref:FAR1 domain-containing protein n=1 Tax=Massarina eburnea CBS 473.64 TaxID=1395130 RepID=A0A6A6SC37_9PLEO|nr:hypothetical protein P280DRAFT_466087 [Massarina eburnea CBS 473.64]